MSDELIKRLREEAKALASSFSDDVFGTLFEAADLIEHQAAEIISLKHDIERHIANHAADLNAVAPAVDAQLVWISVDDRLPDEGQSVAFVVSSASPTFAYLNGRVLGGYFGHVARHPTFSVPGLGLHASHWMPLPTPPHQDPQ